MKLFGLILFSFLLLGSCTKDQTKPAIEPIAAVCDSIPKAFAADVLPIFNNYCVSCHNSSSSSGGYSLENYTQISQNVTISLRTIKHESGVVAMPYLSNAIPDSLIRIIECWVENGAQNN